MLFADLRGFTALCDRLDPVVTVKILNDYFSHMQRAIVRHHGHVTEFVGDGLLALFGALEPNPWQARDAVLAALDMRSDWRTTTRPCAPRAFPNCASASAFMAARSWQVSSAPQAGEVQRHRRSDQCRVANRRADQQIAGGPADHR
jgi:class 3 adenylate cyclase